MFVIPDPGLSKAISSKVIVIWEFPSQWIDAVASVSSKYGLHVFERGGKWVYNTLLWGQANHQESFFKVKTYLSLTPTRYKWIE